MPNGVNEKPVSTAKQSSTVPVPAKKPSHSPSITGIILAVLALLSAGIANLFIHMKYTPTGPTTGSVDREVGHAIATGTTTILGTILGLPFMIGAIILGLISLAFIVIRLRKVKVIGAVISAVAALVAIWGISISISLFDIIKAHPQ